MLMGHLLAAAQQPCSPCPLTKAETPNDPDKLAFPAGTVYLDLGPGIRGTTEEGQIIAGLEAWNTVNQQNGAGALLVIPGAGAGLECALILNPY